MNEVRGNANLRSRLGGFLFGFAFATFWIFLIVVERWAYAAPKVPDVALGQVYAHNEHGSITYFTAFQATSSALMFWCVFVCGALTIGILPKREIKVRRWGRLPLAASWKNSDENGLSKLGCAYGLVAALLVVRLIGPMIVGWVNSRGVVLHI